MKNNDTGVQSRLRTEQENLDFQLIEELFRSDAGTISEKLENFPKYIRRQKVTRFLALYELFKLVLPVKGSIVECGAFNGFGTFSFANFSAVLEPLNFMRHIYAFDSFNGFPQVDGKDRRFGAEDQAEEGDLCSTSFESFEAARNCFDNSRPLSHIGKLSFIKGDATETIPQFFKKNPHVLISLLFLDFDLYKPTATALEHCLPRMPKGAVLAFDELDNPNWPGETLAMLEVHAKKGLEIKRFSFDPYIGYCIL